MTRAEEVVASLQEFEIGDNVWIDGFGSGTVRWLCVDGSVSVAYTGKDGFSSILAIERWQMRRLVAL